MTVDKDKYLSTLIDKSFEIAEIKADGHLTIMKFTTNFKVMLGTPTFHLVDSEIESLKSFNTLACALEHLILQNLSALKNKL